MVFLWVSPLNFRRRIPRQFFRMGIPPETFICHDCLVSNSPMTFAQHSQHNNRDHQITHFGGNKQCKCMFFGGLRCLQQRMVFRMIYVKDSLLPIPGFQTTQKLKANGRCFYFPSVFNKKTPQLTLNNLPKKGRNMFSYIYIYVQ